MQVFTDYMCWLLLKPMSKLHVVFPNLFNNMFYYLILQGQVIESNSRLSATRPGDPSAFAVLCS